MSRMIFYVEGDLQNDVVSAYKEAVKAYSENRGSLGAIDWEKFSCLRVETLSDGTKVFNYPVDQWDVLKKDFENFLIQHFSSPWEATEYVFREYDFSNGCFLELAGEQLKEQKDINWRLIFNFPTDSGLMDTTANIYVHWIKIWFLNNFPEINMNYLQPAGFIAKGNFSARSDKQQFLPLFNVGYGQYYPKKRNSQARLEVDALFGETHDENKSLEMDVYLEKLVQKFGSILADGKCCCQLCSPEFDSRAIERFAS